MFSIETTRYSHVIQAFLAAFPDARAYLDKREQTTASGNWATNKALLGAIDFSLVLNDVELLAFHDGPKNMWASTEAQSVIESLAEQKVLRYRRAKPKQSLFRRFLARVGLASSDA